ncbi:MAG: TIGR01212 family radical SAM protein [Candidatus Omnitrophica bacterium]|nr:TIGR01212 family radical SAM protein [Candidatus Omnitrophota bacterium]
MWIEYGLQSVKDNTLDRLERKHTFKDFTIAVELAKRYGIKTCAHLILGLPGETAKDAVNTAKALNDLKIDGIKIHLLHILKGSRMENIYKEGGIRLLDQAEYVVMVCDLLENLSSGIVIQRLTGEGDRENHIAPLWALDKTKTIRMIGEEFVKRGTYQGKMALDLIS